MTPHKTLIPEQSIPGKPLGRHILHDPQSWGFKAEQAPALKSVKHRTTGLPLDQGQVGSCTAEALVGAGNTAPNYRAVNRRKQADAIILYQLETRNEHQPYPPNDPGGTGLQVCKAAKQLGWIKSYTHAFSINAALRALVLRPVITGIAWYEGFDNPDADGLVTISGQVRGGHEIEIIELNTAANIVGAMNSWGPSWGKHGRFYMSINTWADLLEQQGDVTVPIFS